MVELEFMADESTFPGVLTLVSLYFDVRGLGIQERGELIFSLKIVTEHYFTFNLNILFR